MDLDLEYLWQLAKAQDELMKSLDEPGASATLAHIKVLQKWVEVFDAPTVLRLVELARANETGSND